eukprot:TRINITY_DN3155_c0_g1_i2.p1 TRINITY_DN3155_c0_g1~~TRINITY_DN3155_c0_g1_i2.p1  ORF type:complete len:238 (-),score=18.16 TRINITY_DN3155_c0_g1_i2:19-732(-)
MLAEGFSNDPSSNMPSNGLSQTSYFSEYGTALTITSEAASSMNDTSAQTSLMLEGPPPRQYTVYDLQPHLDELLTPAVRDRLVAQHERFRARRLFRPGSHSNFSSSADSGVFSSFGSCNVHVQSSQNSFAEDVDEGERRRYNISTIPEDRYATLTVDSLPPQRAEVRDQSEGCSFATFGVDDEFDERIMYDGAFTPYTSGHGLKDGATVNLSAGLVRVVIVPPFCMGQLVYGCARVC